MAGVRTGGAIIMGRGREDGKMLWLRKGERCFHDLTI